MRHAKLTILASLSLVTLAVLAWGYVGILSLGIAHVSVTPSGKRDRNAGVSAWGGRFIIGWQDVTNPQRIQRSPGIHGYPYFRFRGPAQPDLFWRFDHARFSAAGYTGANWVYPIWFAALPCTIAPIAWLRRRRHGGTRGFAVEGSQASGPASEPPNQPPERPSDQQTPTGV